MKNIRLLAALSVAVLLLLGTSSAEAGKGKKKKAVRGVVTALENAKASGKFTVQVKAKKKDAATATPTEKTFTYVEGTKFEKVVGKKAEAETKPAAFTDLQKNAQVQVVADKQDQAESVKILSKKKSKKTAKG